VCVAPDVDTKIGFFDGFNVVLWASCWLGLMAISVVLVLVGCKQR
jgi:hypothetical protein